MKKSIFLLFSFIFILFYSSAFGQAKFIADKVSGCSPLNVQFTDQSTCGSCGWSWDFGNGDTATGIPNPVTQYTTAGTYSVKLTINGGSSDSLTIVVFQSPAVNITQGSIVLLEEHTDTLTSVLTVNGTPPYSYTWSVLPGNNSLPVYLSTSSIYTAKEHDTMIVLTVQDALGCQAFDTALVTVKVCETNMKIPNVFTPNEDKINETYSIDGLCDFSNFKITIFNRWGNTVFNSSHYDFHWDGKDSNGNECPDGVYYFLINGKRKNIYGYIHLIRG